MKKTILTNGDVLEAAGNLAHRLRIGFADKPLKIYAIPRGGIPVAYLLLSVTHFDLVSDPKEADIAVDDIIDSGATQGRHFKQYGLETFALFNKKVNPELGWVVFPWEGSEEKSIEDACVRLLQFCGENPEREGLKETPARMAKAWAFWTGGYSQDPYNIFKTFEDGGEKYDEMITVSPIPFYSHCEHHMAAIFGDVYISYLPQGKIAGLSKFARLVDVFSKRLQVQERLTTQIADVIESALKPIGCAVLIKARHFCIESRGVQKSGVYTTTTATRGAFRDDPKVRSEFFSSLER